MSESTTFAMPGIEPTTSEAIEAAAKLLVTLNYEQNGDDVLVAQAKAFLEAVLSM